MLLEEAVSDRTGRTGDYVARRVHVVAVNADVRDLDARCKITLRRVAPDGAAPPTAGPSAVTSAFRAEDGWGCPATGPA